MPISLQGQVAQRFGRIAAVGAVTLLLASAVATPAAAMKRREAVRLTNTAMSMCFTIGGDPASEEADGIYEAEENGGLGGGFSVSCQMPDGSAIWTWIPYSSDESGADERSLAVGDQVTAPDDASAADHGRHQAQQHRQQHKHTSHAAKHGKR